SVDAEAGSVERAARSGKAAASGKQGCRGSPNPGSRARTAEVGHTPDRAAQLGVVGAWKSGRSQGERDAWIGHLKNAGSAIAERGSSNERRESAGCPRFDRGDPETKS